MVRNPTKVKKAVRKSDGFVCAHPKCDVPYLEYHHFDPPWSVENHNNPDGIIAFCPEHHRKADGGIYSIEQMRQWKSEAQKKQQNICSSLDWMKSNICTLFGGVLGIQNRYELMFNDEPVVWINYIDNYACLNINLKDEKGNLLLQMIDNDWEVKHETVSDIECTPLGRRISVKFINGDFFEMNFSEFNSSSDFLKKNSSYRTNISEVEQYFPLAIVDFKANLFEEKLVFDNNSVSVENVTIKGGLAIGCNAGIGFRY